MGTTSEKLEYLNDTKTAIKDAIIAKGVEVPKETTFREYADKIATIPSGNRKVTVHFDPIPYGGMGTHSYTVNNIMVTAPPVSDTFEITLLDGQNQSTHDFNVVCACNMVELPVNKVETSDGQRIHVYTDTNFSYFYVPNNVNEIYMYTES